MPTIPSLQDLLKAGVHFGHRETKWHPKMAPFIFTVRNGIHIIDLEKTVEKLKAALIFLHDVARKGGVALFVGTKPQSRAHVRAAAESVGAPYVTERWLGGTLTNFTVIHKLVKKLEDIERKLADAEAEKKYTKLERLMFDRERERLVEVVGGIRTMKGLPQAMILADVIHDETAVREARRRSIPTIALCDTNADPEEATYPIPANDDASRSIEFIMKLCAGALREGTEGRALEKAESERVQEAAEAALTEEATVVPEEIVKEAAVKAKLKEEIEV
jgi:small subunit ribosomal protein S2